MCELNSRVKYGLKLINTFLLKTKEVLGFRGPFLETPDNFPGPVSIFFELIYLSANGNYWLKLSDMLHEIIKVKI